MFNKPARVLVPTWLNKVTTEIEASQTFRKVEVTEEVIKTVWRNIGCYITDDNVEDVLTWWSKAIPKNSLRLRIILSHTIGSGLTSLDLIQKTLLKVPHFPWLKLYKRYGSEFANVLAAFATVGSNVFFGYRKDMGEAAASKYKRLAWACSKILYTEKSSHSMKGFKGLVEPDDAEMVMTLINT